jgi:ATP-binding cassette subfamily B protein
MARATRLRQVLPGLAHVLRRFLPEIRKERGLVAGAALALMLQVGARLLEPWPLKWLIDRLTGAEATSLPMLDALETSVFVGACALATLIAVSVRAAAAYLSSVGFALAGNRVLTRIRLQVFRHLQTLSLARHARRRSGDWLVRVVSDVGILREAVVTALLPLATQVVLLAGMVAVMLYVDWRLSVAALLPLPLFLLFTLRQSRRIQDVGRQQRRREGDLANAAAESLQSIQTIQAFSLETSVSESFAAASQRDLKQGVKGKRLTAGLERGVDMLVGLSTALVLWLGSLSVLATTLSVGELVLFLTYQRRALRPLKDFAKYTGRIAKATAAGERILELLDDEPDVRERADARAAPRFRGELALRAVGVEYEDAAPFVLRDLDLRIRAGEHVALVGPSGSGKSTLLRLLLRLADPASGSITIDGQPVDAFTLASLRAQIALVPQEPVLFATSVRDNIAAGNPDASDPEIEAAARLARAHDFITRLPGGYASVVGERGATLSQGQRQRIAIARAVLRDASILLLDEPLSGVDPANAGAVRAALVAAARGRTCVWVTHDPNVAASCDRIALLDDGRIVESGAPAELAAAGGRYARFASQPVGEPELFAAEEGGRARVG